MNLISNSKALEFFHASSRLDYNIKLGQIIYLRALALLDDMIHVDTTYPFDMDNIENWMTTIFIKEVAHLFKKYFDKIHEAGISVTESFFNVLSAFSYDNPGFDQRMMAAYCEVIESYTATHGELTQADHIAMATVFGKKFPRNGAIPVTITRLGVLEITRPTTGSRP